MYVINCPVAAPLDEALAETSIFKELKYTPFMVAVLRTQYENDQKQKDDQYTEVDIHNINSELVLNMADNLSRFRIAEINRSAKQITASQTNVALSYQSLAKAYSERDYSKVDDGFTTGAIIKQRASAIAFLFSEEAQIATTRYNAGLKPGEAKVSKLDVINGFKDSTGKPRLGEDFLFKKVYEKLFYKWLKSSGQAKEELRLMLDNFGALAMFSRIMLHRTEGLQLGAFNSYARRVEIEEAEDLLELSESYDAESATRESWMERKDKISAFSSLGTEVRSIISNIPRQRHHQNDTWSTRVDDLGFPIMIDPMYAHNALVELFRGMSSPDRMLHLLDIEIARYEGITRDRKDLEDLEYTINTYKAVRDVIKTDPTLVTKFYVNYKKGFTPYKEISIERGKDGLSVFKTISLNRTYSTGENRYVAGLINWRHTNTSGKKGAFYSLLTKDGFLNDTTYETVKQELTNSIQAGYEVLEEIEQGKEISADKFFTFESAFTLGKTDITKHNSEYLKDRITYYLPHLERMKDKYDSTLSYIDNLRKNSLEKLRYTEKKEWTNSVSTGVYNLMAEIKTASKRKKFNPGEATLDDIYADIQQAAATFGITVSTSALESMRKQRTLRKFLKALYNLYKPENFSTGIFDLNKHVDIEGNQIPFAEVYLQESNKGFRDSVKNVFRYIDDAVASRYERRAKVMDSNGKETTVFSDQNPCFFTDTIDTLMNFAATDNEEGLKEYIAAKYLTSAYYYDGVLQRDDAGKLIIDESKIKHAWLRDWLFNPAALEGLEHARFAQMTIGNKTLSFENISESHHVTALFQDYFYSGSTIEDRKFANYPIFILGDSGISRTIKAPKYTKEQVLDYYVQLFESEFVLKRQLTAVDKALKEGEVANGNKINPNQHVVHSRGLKEASDFTYKTLQFLGSKEQIEALASESPGTIRKAIEEALDKKIKEEFIPKLQALGLLETTEKKDKEGNVETLIYSKFGKLPYFNGKINVLVTSENIDEVISDFYYNSSLAMALQLQLMTVSPNFYKSVEDLQKRYKEIHASGTPLNPKAQYKDANGNTVDVWGPEGAIERVVYFDDLIVNSSINHPEFYELAVKTIKNKSLYSKYLKNTLTDGQSYRTIDSYRKIAISQGLWDVNGNEEVLYQKLIKARKEGRQLNQNEIKEISKLAVVLQPQKPYLYTFEDFQCTYDEVDKDGNIIGQRNDTVKIPVQHKCAEVIIIPELIPSHSPLKQLGEVMIESNIDVLCSTEVVKVGNFGSTEIGFKTNDQGLYVNAYGDVITGPNGEMPKNRDEQKKFENFNTMLPGTDKPDINMPVNLAHDAKSQGISLKEVFKQSVSKGYVHILSLETYYRQQNVPEHIHDSRGVGTQLRKVFFDRLTLAGKSYTHYLSPKTDENGNKVQPTSVRLAGNDYSLDKKNGGRNLARFYNALIVANIMESFDELAKEIQGSEKLSKALQQMVINSSDANYFALINYAITGDGQFLTPLFESCIEHDTSAKLISIFKKRVQKQKMNGGSAVQASAFGLSEVEKDSVSVDDGGLGYKIEEYIDYEDGKEVKKKNIVYMECEIPFDLRYTDALGNEVQLDFDTYCFTKEDEALGKGKEGELRMSEDGKTSLLEKEFPGILDLIAYRIPTERAYSMMNLKVKRFSRKENGGIIKVPAEGTTIAGFDFKQYWSH